MIAEVIAETGEGFGIKALGEGGHGEAWFAGALAGDGQEPTNAEVAFGGRGGRGEDRTRPGRPRHPQGRWLGCRRRQVGGRRAWKRKR